MTCIAGFIERGVAYVGADSAVSYGADHVTVQQSNKLFTIGGYLFGAAGSVRIEQAVRYQFQPPEFDNLPDVRRFMVSTFVPALRDFCRDAGLIEKDGQMEGGFLVAVRGHLFEVDPAFSVTLPDDGITAIGSGMRLALGSLHSTSGIGFSPEVRLRLALQAAVHYDKSCLPPFFAGCSDPSSLRVIQL